MSGKEVSRFMTEHTATIEEIRRRTEGLRKFCKQSSVELLTKIYEVFVISTDEFLKPYEAGDDRLEKITKEVREKLCANLVKEGEQCA